MERLSSEPQVQKIYTEMVRLPTSIAGRLSCGVATAQEADEMEAARIAGRRSTPGGAEFAKAEETGASQTPGGDAEHDL